MEILSNFIAYVIRTFIWIAIGICMIYIGHELGSHEDTFLTEFGGATLSFMIWLIVTYFIMQFIKHDYLNESVYRYRNLYYEECNRNKILGQKLEASMAANQFQQGRIEELEHALIKRDAEQNQS